MPVRVARKQAIAIGMRSRIHNGTIASAIALTCSVTRRFGAAAIYTMIMSYTGPRSIVVSRRA